MRIGSNPSQLLEEHLFLLRREPLQQTLIEDGYCIRQRMGDFPPLLGQMQPNETVISLVVDTLDQAMLFQSLDDAGDNRSIESQALRQGTNREILFVCKRTKREPLWRSDDVGFSQSRTGCLQQVRKGVGDAAHRLH